MAKELAMIEAFRATLNPARIAFGCGLFGELPGEIARLGCKRALLLSTPFQKSDAALLAQELGEAAVGIFADAMMHTPVSVTLRAMAAFTETNADCVVSFGGGSTIGRGKAIAWRNDAPQIVVATTYAGSEVTPILGETGGGLGAAVQN